MFLNVETDIFNANSFTESKTQRRMKTTTETQQARNAHRTDRTLRPSRVGDLKSFEISTSTFGEDVMGRETGYAFGFGPRPRGKPLLSGLFGSLDCHE